MDYFDYDSVQTPGEQVDNPGLDIQQFLEQSQSNNQEVLTEEIERIENQLEQRDRIHNQIIDRLESKRDWYLKRLKHEYNTPGPSSVEDLKKEINRLYSEIRSEKQKHWSDKQGLERDRRELIRELEELNRIDLSELL